ncbi:MAG: hypothetical protein JHD16_08500 [Solirubrobacteraceae bacterium]|nr:hypothetical protein [Solirubrobacteraceae bacterium]
MSTEDPFETHRTAFGAELRRVAPQPRTRRKRAYAMGGATLALAGAATTVLVLAPLGGTRLDVLTEAQAAIATTPDSIIHYALKYDSGYPEREVDTERSRGCEPEPGQVWRATTSGAPRFRMRIPLNPCSVSRIGDRIATGSFDVAYGDRTESLYSETDGFMIVTKGLPPEADEQQPMLPVGDERLTEGESQDPVARIRSMLRDGKLADAGELPSQSGRALRRLVGEYSELRGDPADPSPRKVSVDYRVDAETFAPVEISVTRMQLVPEDVDAPIGRSPMVRRELTDVTTFSTYETIPLNRETERLLTVQPKPGTDVVSKVFDRDDEPAKPSKAEEARAQKIIDAQIAAGTRVRGAW